MNILQHSSTFLRRSIGVVASIALVLAATTISTQKASAACSVSGTNYGTATMQLVISSAGTYKIWSHVNAPDATNNSFLMEIDGGTCVTVGDSNVTANTWSWVNHQNGTLTSKITANLTAGTHTIKVIGREPNVKIDRILAVQDQNCTPTGLGDNCMVTSDTTKPTVSMSSPAESATVSGTVNVAATAADNTSVSKVEFMVQNQVKETDTASPYSYSWDTSSLSNGTYTVSAKVYDVAGNSAVDTRTVTVKNGDSEKPSAPTGFTGTATAPNRVALTWNASTDNVKVTGYRVYRNDVVIATVTTTSHADTSATASTKYAYKIVAIDAAGNASAATSVVTVTTPTPTTVDTTAPTKPSGLTATPVSTNQINVAWTASTDNVGVKEYVLYRAGTEIARTQTTSYGDANLKANTTYEYYVIARDAANNASTKSDTASAKTNAQPSTDNPSTGVSTVRGTVQGRNGRPIVGARVTIWVDGKRYKATTNWRGKYIITNIPAGNYEVYFKARGYWGETEYVRAKAGKTKWEDVTLWRR